tara:strand:- start:477 stop:656 length:180 start_codon:yes stop_codon:yes gene_type:complete
MTQQVSWPRPNEWDDRPPIKVDEPFSPSMDKGKNVGSTNKGGRIKKPTAQASRKNTGLY